ncbi:putative cholinesterase [Podospora australis]|uniref:Cholinesterase n=1 Tax=Podospora australis TaxID=1536484 RepID=A0AAN6X632_9PEZI|nr:putative cholinesterase [Podospora australis]
MHCVLGAVTLLAGLAAGQSLKRLDTSLAILTNNDLQGKYPMGRIQLLHLANTRIGQSSPSADTAVIVTDARSSRDGYDRICSALGEQPFSEKKGKGKATVLQPLLNHLRYEGRASASSKFWVSGSTISATGETSKGQDRGSYPVLCTNKAPYSNESSQDTSSKWQISVDVNNQSLTGLVFTHRLSFRFLGVRYAAKPERFTYSSVFKGKGEATSALEHGSQCAQGSDTGSEDCLFLNVWTPYLPNPNSRPDKKQLRPVAFWIHGGAFTGGTANDATFDGGNMASRGDVVVVAINYRLSTLGFLALKDGKTNGNYGLADQITALEWVRKNIQSLGGDPDRVTIFGQSAGAGSVRALIASPKATGKFSSAILLSNLGGINYGTTYSKYYTIDEQVSVAANTILSATNCTNAASQVDCLRALPASTLTKLGGARYIVQDGTYITSSELSLSGPQLPINIMMGITHDDGAPFINFPKTTNQTEYLSSQGFSLPPPSLFPVTPTTGNRTLDLYNASARLATDGIFRCIDQATAYTGLKNRRFKPVYYYEFDRTYQTTGWPKTDVCEPPRTKSHPNGDPSLPYLKCHSGELYYVFGTLARQGLPMRDEGDLPFEQFVLDSFVSFIRTGDPNPDKDYLKARGYKNTLEQVERASKWKPATKEGGMTLRSLNWPVSRQGGFRELEQCEGLGLGLGYYGAK